MTTQPKISVIIPVYNTAEYLQDCLKSVCNQTLKDIEIICVNDGATDNSQKILEQFVAQDVRIKIFQQENSGTAKARENAIKACSAKWLAYVDSDDYVSPDYLQKLYYFAQEQNADIAFSYYFDVIHNQLRRHKKKIKAINVPGVGKIPYITGPSKIARKELFNNIVFAKDCCFGEDSSISMQLALQMPKIKILPEFLYFYRRHPESTVLKKGSIYPRLHSLLRGYLAVEEFCQKQPAPVKTMDFLYSRMIKQITNLLKGECR